MPLTISCIYIYLTKERLFLQKLEGIFVNLILEMKNG